MSGRIFFSDFSFRGSYDELLKKYPDAKFEVRCINGQQPPYWRSHYPPGTRLVSLRTSEPDTGNWEALTRWLKTPEKLHVVDIALL
jgi:hypothetical protein